MADNVVHLPRPAPVRPEIQRLGLYLHVGHNHHKELLALLAEGVRDFFGIVVSASHVDRHKELISEALNLNLDVILDPQTQRAATPGGYTSAIGELPWSLDRPHHIEDFDSHGGRERANQIAEFAHAHGFTQLLGPTHLLQGPNDPWLRRDINTMGCLRSALDKQQTAITLIYPLALPIRILRDRVQRQAIVAAMADAPFDGLWLKIENFGSDSTGEKTAAYIEACADFHSLGVPIVSDQVGGLPGLGLLAYGAVGGIAHGITMLEGFRPASWRKLRDSKQGGGVPLRVFIPELDVLLKPADAATFFKANSRVQSRFGCRDTHCCPKGVSDTLRHPARHFVRQRARQINSLSSAPPSLRVQSYLDNEVRRVSDEVAAVASFRSLDESIKKAFSAKQKTTSRFRQAMVHLANANPIGEPAQPPLDRRTRERK